MRKPERPRSKRERIEEVNRGLRAWGTMFGKPEVAEKLVTHLPPKREIRRPVDNKPVGPSEHQEQCRVIAWWALQHQKYNVPHFALYAVPNGGARDVITGARLKAEGVRRGTPDLVLDVPRGTFHGMRIEMKARDGRASEDQGRFIEYLNNAGYRAEVHWSSESAINAIKEYLA